MSQRLSNVVTVRLFEYLNSVGFPDMIVIRPRSVLKDLLVCCPVEAES